MPELSGYEVCEILKSDNSTQHIPVLMISALGQNAQERIKGLNVGADAFISKPFSQAELRAQVNVALRIRKVEDLLRTRNENLELNVRKIENYQKRLKSLNKEITLVEERERRRIAENLHDSLGQTLSLAFLKLSSIESENCSSGTKKILNETSDLINIAISESRSLTYDLSPPILYELGLIPAIKWKLEQIEEKQKIQTDLSGEDQKINLNKEYNIFIYRIVCELFANTIKHAKANKIEVKIMAKNEICRIIVIDNGLGFNSDLNKTTTNGGFGLLSITERLDSIQGRIEIESAHKKGTKAIITIPFNKNLLNEN
jgi:two-component system sensor histidine kinase/response regulator